MNPILLEDNYTDILGKALRGQGLAEGELAQRVELSPDRIHEVLAGKVDQTVIRKIAPELGLNAEALMALANHAWRPTVPQVEGVAQFNTPWNDMTVNSYLLWDPHTREAAAFDTGADCDPMMNFLREKDLTLTAIFLTHTHGDHVFDLDRLRTGTNAPAYVGDREPLQGAESFAAGRAFKVGGLSIETRLTWGHSQGGITYVVAGLSQPVAAVGDAVFAGSMGGGTVSYADALRTNKEEILSLSDETVICPGHGPMTTVGQEKRHNPFFAR